MNSCKCVSFKLKKVFILIILIRIQLPLSSPRIDHLPLSSSESVQMTDGVNTPRLEDLLKLQDSMLNTFSQTPTLDNNESSSGDQIPGLEKRVFCNGFTGCGGRFRGRRRQQPVAEIWKRLQPVFRKRPFCNSYGCYKRFGQVPPSSEASQATARVDRWPEDRTKKLFCNGYGGCQNLGKRLVILDDDVPKEVGQGQRTSSPLTKALLNKLEGRKRLFSSSLDQDFDNLIINLVR